MKDYQIRAILMMLNAIRLAIGSNHADAKTQAKISFETLDEKTE